jgi:hypothetical protein
MGVSQSAFRAALLDPAARVPQGLTDPAGRPAGARFDVYRNNVVASLSGALESGFPAVARLVGPELFRALAVAYSRTYPPRSPLIMHMGSDLPAFLESFPPTARRGYLPDLARLELAVRESYHAADAEMVASDALAGLAPEVLVGLRMTLAPAVRLVSSRYPIVQIRAFALDGGPTPCPGGETALVMRPGYDPQVTALAPAAAAFVTALADGQPLGTAAGQGAAHDARFDPSAPLAALIAGGAVISLHQETAS